MNAIKATGLTHTYPDGTNALMGVDFEAKCGEKIAVLGPNGSGKSTLFYHFNGLIKPTGGEIKVFGEDIRKDNIDLIRKRVGLVFQTPDSQLFAPTVFEDIAYGPENLGFKEQAVNEMVHEVMRRFDIPELGHKNPANLSGGQKKRVAIAGVAVMEPDVMVLDEPTSGLDASGIADTMELLDELNDEGKTIIISTHDSDLASAWADRVYILNKGKVLRSGEPKHIFSEENLMAKTGLNHPVIVSTFREFRARGISKGETPLSVLELMDSVDVNVMTIRCAIAGCDLLAGEDIFLKMQDGMLFADKKGSGVRGKVVFNGRKGEDIAVKEVTGDLQQLAGSIAVIRIPGIAEGGTRAVETGMIRELLNDIKPQKIAAMGTSAKALMGSMNIRCDIEFDVIQASILAALRGFDVAVFASGGMAQRAVMKIKEKNIRYSCPGISSLRAE